MAIPRKALLLEELTGMNLCTLEAEARYLGYVRAVLEAGTCSLTKFEHVAEILQHCGKLGIVTVQWHASRADALSVLG
jgi:hypothetical protein